MKLDVLAVGAHPDDIELTCGGTVIKLVKQGRSVGILDLTEGELGTRGDKELRAREAAQAAKILGIQVRENLKLPDGNIGADPDNRLKLVRLLRSYRPDILLIPYPTDRHPDHERAHILCREAWFASGLPKVATEENGKSQDAFRPRAYYHYMQWHEFTPSFIVDISAEYDQRMDAVHAYRSQLYDPKSNERETILTSPAFLEMVRTRLEYYGDRINVKYGEPFFSTSSLRIDDLVRLNA